MSNKIKVVSVDYIESGTFVGGEEDCYNADINKEEPYVVIKEIDYALLQITANKYVKILNLLAQDESGDLDFIKFKVDKDFGRVCNDIRSIREEIDKLRFRR